MMLFERTPKDEAIELIRSHLAEELRESSTLTRLAENIEQVAEEWDVPVSMEPGIGVLWWIHQRPMGKRWSIEEFRRFAKALRSKA